MVFVRVWHGRLANSYLGNNTMRTYNNNIKGTDLCQSKQNILFASFAKWKLKESVRSEFSPQKNSIVVSRYADFIQIS